MKNRTQLLVVLLIAITGAGLGVSAFADGDKKHQDAAVYFVNADSAPAKVVTAFHRALESNDPQTARALLLDDVLIFEGGVERSADEYADHHMLADIEYLAAVETTVLEHRVEITGHSAVSISRSKTIGTYRDKKIDNEGLETMVLHLINGSWKISHIHWSH